LGRRRSHRWSCMLGSWLIRPRRRQLVLVAAAAGPCARLCGSRAVPGNTSRRGGWTPPFDSTTSEASSVRRRPRPR
jgi:hypothetical protein